MSESKIDVVDSEHAGLEDNSRRGLALALLGVLGSASLLEGCAPDGSPQAESLANLDEALSGTVIKWVDTILGAVPTSARTGDLNQTSAALGGPIAVIAKRCIANVDGGGGLFVWNATGRVGDTGGGAALVDDGGTIIVPGGVVGTSAVGIGCWQRIYSGPLNVRWFGTVGNGVADDRLAIQNAIDLGVTLSTGVSYSGLGSSGFMANTGPVILLPVGVYAVGRAAEGFKHGLELPGSLTLQGESGTIITSTEAAGNEIALLRMAGRWNTIRNIQFVRGHSSIAICGPTVKYGLFSAQYGGTSNVIERCHFLTPAGPAILQDANPTSSPYVNRSIQMPIVVTDFSFMGPHLFWGTGDHVVFERGIINWDQTNIAPQLSGDGKPLGCFNSSGHVFVNHCMMSPSGSSEGSPAWPQRAAWFVGAGIFKVSHCNQFDVAACFVRCSYVANTYQGLADAPITLPTESGYRLTLIVSDSWINATNTNWLEVYDHFPAKIAIRDNSYVPLENSFGIWIHDGVPLNEILQRHKILQVVGVDNFRQIRAGRLRRSADNLWNVESGAGVTDLTAHFQQYYDGEPWEENVTEVPPSANLFLPGIYDGLQISAGGGSGDWTDVTTGYSLQGWTAVTEGQIFSMLTPAWGSAMPAGVYVFAFYIKANYSGLITLGYSYGGQYCNIAPRRFHAADGYQRIWFSFYFPGGGATFQFVGAIYFIPNGGKTSVGLFSVHHGATPARYTFPVDNAATPTTNVTSARMTAMYGAAIPPASGSYIAGDVVINDAPSPSKPYGWRCVASGQPGTWAPLDTVSGATGNRPTSGLAPGLLYFDTTLNRPIWRNAANTGWVDSAGSSV